ncbi:MAG: hypothetical protein JXR07_02605 [Reichenbachiella sp.]
MRKTVYVCFFWTIFGLNFQANAQDSNRRCINIKPNIVKVVLKDSLVIDPASISISNGTKFTFNQSNYELKLGSPTNELLEICYRVIPVRRNKTFLHKSTAIYDSSAAFKPLFMRKKGVGKKEELFATPNIYKTGSLTRGISFGNAQSVNVISSFNFQMDGKLTEKLNIRADITDQNVPFQPEGNTQQLREFDNVTFEIYNENLSLKAGDVLLQNSPSHFLKYYKNVLGGSFDIKYGLKEGKGQSSVAVAAAKGQFVDITLDAEEGLQGPYQLHGPDGQNYVIVMANSEKVYLDGQLMVRGYNNDYTIDYNLGEVTFNPNILVTQFSRIRVTFEYSDQNYSRSILSANQEISMGKLSMNFAYYLEKDDIHRPLSFQLSDDDKLKMSLAGDDNLPVPINSEMEVDYVSNLVLYEKIDTVDFDGNLQTIFRYSRDSTQTLYQVSFSQVEMGEANYVLSESEVNGRVYEWVSPQLGISLGNYAAVRFVPAPNMKQMAVIGAKVDLNNYVNFYSEVAFSNHDLNLYSDIDNEDNKDLANKSGISIHELPINFMNDYTLSANLDFEYNGKDFNAIDRFRPIEYDRNWSYNSQTDTFRTSNNIFNVGLEIKKNARNLFNARFSTRDKENAIDGQQLDLNLRKAFGPVNVSGSYFDMENQSFTDHNTWERWHGEAYFDRFFVVPGYKVSSEDNQVRINSSDSLTRTAMNFQAQQFYLRSNDTTKTHFKIEHIIREDKNVLNGELIPYVRTNTTSANLTSPQGKKHFFNLTMTYRELAYQAGYSDLDDESLVLGRVQWRSSYLKNHIRADMNYATSSSREILREYIYVQVATGEGTHTWRDLNGDGVQDISEFFEAINFDERNYIKVFVPTSDFINAFNTLFVFTFNGEMPRSWKNGTGLKRVLGRFSNRTNVNINKKTTNDDFSARFNPFSLDIDDADLIFARDGLRSTMFYNKSGRGLGLDFTYVVNRSKQLISRGIDSRNNTDYITNLRYHISREISLTGKLVRGEKRNASQFEETRNYTINNQEISPGIIWQPTNNMRLSVLYRKVNKENIEAEAEESSEINEGRLETRWSRGTSNSLSANFTFTKIDFIGDLNTASAYELLNALQPGNNMSWQLSFNQKLISGLQMNLGYEGRKSENQEVIHMGRLQITALF